MKKNLLTTLLCCLILLGANAQFINGMLDSTFNGWATSGNGVANPGAFGSPAVQPFMVSSFGPNIVPQAGVHMAQLSSGGNVDTDSLTSFAQLPVNTIGSYAPYATVGSAIQQTVTVPNGAYIELRWLFLTKENPTYWDPVNQGPNNEYNDFCFFSVAGSQGFNYVTLSDLTALHTYSQTYGPALSYNGYYAYNNWSVRNWLLGPGTHTITIGVMDAGDTSNHSGLLVDFAFMNNIPLCADITYTGIMNLPINFAHTDFQNNFTDTDTSNNVNDAQFVFQNAPLNGYVIRRFGTMRDTLTTTWNAMPIAFLDSIEFSPMTGFIGIDSVEAVYDDGMHQGAIPMKIYFNISGTTETGELPDSDVSVYPNPSDGLIQFRFTNYLEGELALFNVTGEKILVRAINGNSAIVDCGVSPPKFRTV